MQLVLQKKIIRIGRHQVESWFFGPQTYSTCITSYLIGISIFFLESLVVWVICTLIVALKYFMTHRFIIEVGQPLLRTCSDNSEHSAKRKLYEHQVECLDFCIRCYKVENSILFVESLVFWIVRTLNVAKS